MTTKFNIELEKIVSMYAKKDSKKELKECIINLFEAEKNGLLEDEVHDKSHISINQTSMFDK